MNEPQQITEPTRPPDAKPKPRPLVRRTALAAALLAACAAGAGAAALAQRGHQVTLVPLPPAPIAAMKDWSPVAVKGQVIEVFGNKFVLQDDSGRALIETGRRGESGTLVAKSETVTVQGRFEHGFVHAMAIQHGDGKIVLLDPPPPPPPPHGPLS